MPKLIKDGEIVEDRFVPVTEEQDGQPILPPAPILVRLGLWQRHRDALLAHPHAKGVQLAPDEFAESIEADLSFLDLIAIEFPAFADGRGYSTARLLRSRYGFQGELRAVGDVFKDTLFYQKRCGFNAFLLKTGKSVEEALSGMSTFSVAYQGATDSLPLFQQRHGDYVERCKPFLFAAHP